MLSVTRYTKNYADIVDGYLITGCLMTFVLDGLKEIIMNYENSRVLL